MKINPEYIKKIAVLAENIDKMSAAKILGLENKAIEPNQRHQEARESFRKRAAEFHPDKLAHLGENPEYSELIKNFNKIYSHCVNAYLEFSKNNEALHSPDKSNLIQKELKNNNNSKSLPLTTDGEAEDVELLGQEQTYYEDVQSYLRKGEVLNAHRTLTILEAKIHLRGQSQKILNLRSEVNLAMKK